MDTPDIASIVSMIMSNPGLVEQISRMANGGTTEESSAADEKDAMDEKEVSAPIVAPPIPERRVHRAKLVNAMKPYLSEGRQRAIDAMLSITDILDITREKK